MARRLSPALQLDVRPQPLLQALIAVLAAASATAVVAALMTHDTRCWPLLALVPLLSYWAWRAARIAPRKLQWDGQTWRLGPPGDFEPGPPVQIEIVMDFGTWLLLRAHAPGAWLPQRSIYLPLQSTALGAAWGGLRATLYSARQQIERP